MVYPRSPKFVARQCVNPLNRDEQPIILVPGIMGSRIHAAGDKNSPIWDPDDTMAMLKLADMYTSYRADWLSLTHRGEVFVEGFAAKTVPPALQKLGWGGVAWGFYGDGLSSLAVRSSDIGGVVYAFGYDWRQSNWLSGMQLAYKIRKIREAHRNRKVLVVTHSMGGLVVRAACKIKGTEANILGVVHTMQPANGTPLAYRQCKTGGAALEWVLADVVLGRIVGRTPLQYAAVSCGLRAPFELLPNDSHWRATGNEPNESPGKPEKKRAWLTIGAGMKLNLPQGSSMYDVYKEHTGKVGLIDYDDYNSNTWMHINEAYILDDYVSGPAIASGFQAGVDGARNFHENWVQNYVHPNTSVVAGNSLETDVALQLDRETHWFSDDTTTPQMIRENLGDGTVSISSSTSLPLSAKLALKITDKDRQKFVDGVAHAAAFGTSQVFNDLVWKMCQQVLECSDGRD